MASQDKTMPLTMAMRRRSSWRSLPLGCLLLTATLHALALWCLSSGPRQAPVPVTPPSVTGRLVATLAPASASKPRPGRQEPPSPAPMTQRHRAPQPARTVSPAAATAVKPVTAPSATSQAPALAPTRASVSEVAVPVSPPVSQASGLNNQDPPYPALSQRLGEEGVVVLSVLILANGNVAEVAIQRSSGYPRLDEAALAAVRRWHYHPARRAGVAIDYRYSQPIRFAINESNE